MRLSAHFEGDSQNLAGVFLHYSVQQNVIWGQVSNFKTGLYVTILNCPLIKAERAKRVRLSVAENGRPLDVCGGLWTGTCLAQFTSNFRSLLRGGGRFNSAKKNSNFELYYRSKNLDTPVFFSEEFFLLPYTYIISTHVTFLSALRTVALRHIYLIVNVDFPILMNSTCNRLWVTATSSAPTRRSSGSATAALEWGGTGCPTSCPPRRQRKITRMVQLRSRMGRTKSEKLLSPLPYEVWNIIQFVRATQHQTTYIDDNTLETA